METKLKQVHEDYAQKVRKATENNKLNSLLATATEADKQALLALESIDKSSGGGLMRLMAIYTAIKQNS